MLINRKLIVLSTSLFLLTKIALTAFANPLAGDIQRALKRIDKLPEIESWEVINDDCSITLTSIFAVQASGSKAIATDSEESESLQANGQQQFNIKINFVPFNNYSDLESLESKRAELANKLKRDALDFDTDPLTEEEWIATDRMLAETPNITHIAGESLVYITSDLDNPNISFNPSVKLKDCIWMKYQLGLLFSEIVK